MIALFKIFSTLPLGQALVSFKLLKVMMYLIFLWVGGLIVLSLFIRQWGVDQCARVFDTITHEFFRGQRRKNHGIFSSIRHFASCWLSDGIYDIAALERVLKDAFGTYERMFGSVQIKRRAKIAVTATTISDASPYIFSNYNGVMARQPDCGKRIQPFIPLD